MKIKHIVESSAGATTSGSVATVSMPIGEIQKRNMPEKAPKVVKGKKYANVIKEGKMKDLAYDLEHLDNANFKKKYGKTKEEIKSSLKEERISEDDVIVVPGQIKKKDRSFIPHEKDRRDHEVEMARSEIYAAAKDAMRIFKLLKDRSEDQGIMGWQQSYITLASDYLNSVADSLEYQMNMYEMTGGVIAGGMSNFEEGRYYNPLDQDRREQAAMDQERRDFKRREMEYELRNEPKNNYAVHIDGRSWKVFGDKGHAEAVARKLRMKGKKAEVFVTGAPVSEAKAHKCPECGGKMVSEELMNEKKDACYYKVKSRYKVWPSAYASGALVKCRKKGASNWGNKSKK